MTQLEDVIFASAYTSCLHAGNSVPAAVELASRSVLQFRDWLSRGERGNSAKQLFGGPWNPEHKPV